MKITAEMIRRLQKDGEYRFEGLERDESKKVAEELVRAAMIEDRKNGVKSNFKTARTAFGHYFAIQIN